MVAVKTECPKCGSPRLYAEQHHDGTDHYCPICGFRQSFQPWEERERLELIGAGPNVGKVVQPVGGQKYRRRVKACEECGSEYHGSGQSRYCSDPCRRKGYRKKRNAARAA